MSAHVRTCLQISGAMPGASLELPGAVRPSEISAPARPVHSNCVFLQCPTLVHVAISKSPRFMRRSGLFNVRQEFSFWCSIRTLSPQTYRTIRTHEGIKKRASRPHKSIFIGFSHVVSVLVPCCSLVGFLLFPCWQNVVFVLVFPSKWHFPEMARYAVVVQSHLLGNALKP